MTMRITFFTYNRKEFVMARYLIDESGDLIDEFNDDDSIVAYNYANIQRRKIQNKLFYKLYKDTTLIFTKDYMDYRVLITLFKLIRLLDFNTNEFVSFNGLPATIGQLCEYLKMNSKTFYNHIKKLEKLEIVKKVSKGRYRHIIINPYFIGYGENNTDEALKMFGKSIWAKNSVYSKRKRKVKI